MIEMQKLRSGVGIRNSIAILRQVSGKSLPSDLDELADSLTQFVIADDGRIETIDAVAHAQEALGLSGMATGPGVPYAGASQRLQTIAEQSVGHAGGALMLLARSANRSDAVRRLRDFAINHARLTEEAITQLDRNAGEEGVAAIKVLYENSIVLPPQGRRTLDRIARTRRWERRQSLPPAHAGPGGSAKR